MSSANPPRELPPDAALLQLITGKFLTHAVAAAAKLRIADQLAVGPASSEDLAHSAGLHPGALHRLLRALASVHLLSMDADGRFCLTESGSLLRSDVEGSLRDFAVFMGEEFHSRAWAQLPYSVNTGKPAFDHVFGSNAFEYFGKEPKAGAIFNAAMTSFTTQIAYALIAAYDFTGIKRLIDVGGGHGTLLASILSVYPEMTGAVVEMPTVVEGTRKIFLQKGLQERAEAIAGDFFVKLPPGGDAYLLKHIVHDWDDERVVRLLRVCKVAMGESGRLLLVEVLMPSAASGEAGFAALMDLEMLVMTQGGRERTEEEFRGLLQRAGLHLTRVVPTASPVFVIEARVLPPAS